jgi:colanic acid/amylovoran biosynthesis glycosyltransferase
VLTVAYLANQFPAAVEPYVGEEIGELRRRGVRVVAGSVRTSEVKGGGDGAISESEILCLQPLRLAILLRALGLMAKRWDRIAGLVKRVLLQGKESPGSRVKALLHTWLGAYYAVLLRERGVDHIHAHHGYFGSWIAMVAARLLGASFSLTLHGSDLLIDGVYLDTKLKHCRFCVTISEYNQRYILKRFSARHFPEIDRGKIMVSRLGVDLPDRLEPSPNSDRAHTFTLLAVGRLHAVKDHAFLIRACARLRDHGVDFECRIAGEGPERERLERSIKKSHMEDRIKLLGHVAREQMDSLYRCADVVVLTSRSEGVPLVLMEAMARGRIVLAPAITGIPELVIAGKTGFLYAPGVVKDLVEKIFNLQRLAASEDCYAASRLGWIRHAARAQVLHNFNHQTNLRTFADRFLQRITSYKSADESPDDEFDNQDFPNHEWSHPDEDIVLQQI